MLGTVCRVGDLLELFDTEAPEWGATAVSRELGIAKSQAHEMLVSLEAIGLLRRAGKGRFRLGWKMVTLGERVLRSEFTKETGTLLRNLGRHAQTSVDLVTFDGERCVRVGGWGPPAHSRGEATRTGHVSATGKVLLSGMDEALVAALLPAFDLELELRRVRTRQIAFAFDEVADRHTVAAPVTDAFGTVTAAVGIAVEPPVWADRGYMLSRAVVGTARRLSTSVRQSRQLPFVMGEPGLAGAAPVVKPGHMRLAS